MGQKTISLPEKLYSKLKSKKRENETFPDLITRLLNEEEQQQQKHHISDLAGAFEEDSDEWIKIEKELYKDRLRPSSRKGISFD